MGSQWSQRNNVHEEVKTVKGSKGPKYMDHKGRDCKDGLSILVPLSIGMLSTMFAYEAP